MMQWTRLALQIGVSIALAIQLCGCSPRTAQERGAEHRGEDPRTRFHRIMERFKRHCSGASILVPMRSGDQLVSRFVVDDVAYEVAGSDEPAVPWTAEMTIKTSTHYSLMAGPPPASDAAASGTEPRESSAAVLPNAAAEDTPETPSALQMMTAEELLGRRSEEQTETYRFAFEQGRWVLETEEIDPSIRESLVFVLRRQ